MFSSSSFPSVHQSQIEFAEGGYSMPPSMNQKNIDFTESDSCFSEGHMIEFSLKGAGQLEEKLSHFMKDRNQFGIPFAVVSGCGPAGCVAALTLKQNGFNVLMVEKRTFFTRTNFLELKKESIFSLAKLSPDGELLQRLLANGLSPYIQSTLPQEIKRHKNDCIFQRLKNTNPLPISIRLPVQKHRLSIEALDLAWPYHEKIEDMKPCEWFIDDVQKMSDLDMGSCRAYDLEKTLNQFCLDQGIHILNAQLNLADTLEENSCYNMSYLFQNGDSYSCEFNHPNLVCIGEGASSKNVSIIGEAVCIPTEEAWHQVNFQCGNRLFKHIRADSKVDIEKDHGRLVNMTNTILHKFQHSVVINASLLSIGKRSEKTEVESMLLKKALNILERVIPVDLHINEKDFHLITQTESPIEIKLKRASAFVKGNAVILGDSACSGSPVGGYGASLALCAYPQLLEDLIKNNNGFRGTKIYPSATSLSRYQDGCEKIVRVRWGRPSQILKDAAIYSEETFEKQLVAQFL